MINFFLKYIIAELLHKNEQLIQNRSGMPIFFTKMAK